MTRRASALLLALLLAAAPAKCDSAQPSASPTSHVSVATNPANTPAPEPYDATTLLVTARFAQRPRVELYNYILGDVVCTLTQYSLESGDSGAYLIALTFPDALAGELESMDYDTHSSILRMSLGVMETLGYVLATEDTVSLYGMPCTMFAAYTSYSDTAQYAGWATLDSHQAVFAFATADDAGYAFLGTVTTRRQLEFTADGKAVAYGNATLNFPYAPDVQGSTAESRNSLTCERAELIALPDMATLIGDTDADTLGDMLYGYVPEGAVDVSTQTIGDTLTMLYSYDDAELGRPLRGRLLLLDGCVLRMEATFDEAGDAFMDGVYLE